MGMFFVIFREYLKMIEDSVFGIWFQAHFSKISFPGWKHLVDIATHLVQFCRMIDRQLKPEFGLAVVCIRFTLKNLSWRNGVLFSDVRLDPSKTFSRDLQKYKNFCAFLHFYQNILTSILENNFFFFSIFGIFLQIIWLRVTIKQKMC